MPVAQNQSVLELFEKSYKALSASQVYQELLKKDQIDISVPLTSIRRSISDLNRMGLLTKTDTRVMGRYGAKENTYCRSREQ